MLILVLADKERPGPGAEAGAQQHKEKTMLDMSTFWKSLKEAAHDLTGVVIKETTQLGDCRKRWPGTIKSAVIETEQGTVRLHYVDCYGWCRNA